MNMMLLDRHPQDDLLLLAESFSMDAAFADQFDARVKQRLLAYDSEQGSGLKIAEHLNRVAEQAKSFLSSPTGSRNAYSKNVIENVVYAYGKHDMAKTLDDIEEWRTGPLKPDLSHLSAEEKAARTVRRQQHTRGQWLVDEIAQEIADETNTPLKAADTSLLNLIKYIMADHHEDLIKTGPQAKPADQQGLILRTLVVIDTLDGKRKNNKSLEQNLHEMSKDPKYDATIVYEFALHLGIPSLANNRTSPGLAKPALS